ncbi:pantetheinase-like [Macrobrachium nipponense]|uniref:pantetheinase-like n=1 Tax=Macrobrachium nipponense TaxID=159736 RepID=UPI0030C8BBBA
MLSFTKLLVIACASSFLIVAGEYIGYRAAALQYHSFDDITGGGFAALQENANEYIKYIEEASAQGAQILVFPEHGLTGLTLGSTLGEYFPQTQVVPDPEAREVPCDYTDVPESSLIMHQLSCAALKHHIYLVVCLAEQFNCSQVLSEDESYLQHSVDANAMPNGCEFYDTQVVFDDAGAVVARYRKKHLFIEGHFIEGTDPDSSAMFETSFGVTFTLMISFDLLFYDPAVSNMENFGVRDVITSSGWMDQLPFLVAPQIWKGFSEGYQANLIAANHYNPMEGFLGAGIFRGVASDPEEYTYDTSSGTKLIIGDVLTHAPVSPRKNFTSRSERALSHNTAGHSSVHLLKNKDSMEQDSQEIATGKSKKRHERMAEVNIHQKYKHEILDHYSYSILNKTKSGELIQQTLINHQNSFTCSVIYTYPPGGSEDFLYMLISYTGLIEHGNFTYFLYNENCAVVLCLNENIESCAQIEGAYLGDSTFRPYTLVGFFNGPYIYPAILTDSVQLFNSAWWNYSLVQEENFYQATINIYEEVNDVLTLGLYSRLFSMDPEAMQ